MGYWVLLIFTLGQTLPVQAMYFHTQEGCETAGYVIESRNPVKDSPIVKTQCIKDVPRKESN